MAISRRSAGPIIPSTSPASMTSLRPSSPPPRCVIWTAATTTGSSRRPRRGTCESALSIQRGAGVDALRLQALGLEGGEDRFGMGAVAGLHRHVEPGALGGHVEEAAL